MQYCVFSTDGQFETEIEQKDYVQQMAKFRFLISKKPWSDIDSSKIEQQLLRALLYYGDKWKCMNAKQWELFNNSVSYKISSYLVKYEPNFNSCTIVDDEMTNFVSVFP